MSPYDKVMELSDPSTSQKIPETVGSQWERHRTGPLLEPPESVSMALLPLNHERILLYYLKPPTLRHFIGKPQHTNTRTD